MSSILDGEMAYPEIDLRSTGSLSGMDDGDLETLESSVKAERVSRSIERWFTMMPPELSYRDVSVTRNDVTDPGERTITLGIDGSVDMKRLVDWAVEQSNRRKGCDR